MSGEAARNNREGGSVSETDNIHSIRWEMDDEGGSMAFVFVYRDDTVAQRKHPFDSLDDLPEHIAELILEHGGTEGEIIF